MARKAARNCVRKSGQVAERQPDAPQPEAGVALVVGPGHVRHLVGPEVERADHDRLLAHRLNDAGIGLEVDVFGRLDVGAEVEEFGAVEPDAVGAAIDAMVDFVRKLDIAQQLDADAIERFGRQIAERLELAGLDAGFFGPVAIAGQRLFVGLENHQALVAVDDRQFAAGDVGQERAGADDGGDFQGLGDDRRVAARPADLGHETADEAAVEIGRFARREVMSQDEHGRGKVRDPFAAAAEQMPQQSLFDVEDVIGPLGQVGRLQALEHLGVAAEDAADGVFRRVMPLTDHLLQFAAEPRVLEHLQVGLEDGAVLFAQLGGDALAVMGNFRRRGGDRLVEPFELVDHGIAGHEAARDSESLGVHHQRLADGYAWRDGNPL